MAVSPTERIVIDVRNLSKLYGDIRAVDDVSFSVERGEVFGILGPNGAGKTTTLECIEGLTQPTGGSTTVLGIDTLRDVERVKQRIGVQLQASAYFDHLTLAEILDIFSRFYEKRVPPDMLLERVNLQERAGTAVNKLSGGQQQRFSIAAALVNDPDVVFLDEPTTGLDPQARRSLWGFIRQMNDDGTTVVLTTHYMEEAEFLCHRVAIMDQGRIVAMDTPANLIRTLPSPYEVRIAIAERDSDAEVSGLEHLAGVDEVIADGGGIYRLRCSDASKTVSELMAWAAAGGVSPTHLEVVPSNLEDVFLAITGRALRD